MLFLPCPFDAIEQIDYEEGKTSEILLSIYRMILLLYVFNSSY